MDYLKVGFIKKPHGLKGELKVLPLTDNKSRFKKLKTVFLNINNQFIEEELEYSHNSNDDIIIKLKKFNNIDDVKKFASVYIFIDKNLGVPLACDEFYSQDLIGCMVSYKDLNLGIVNNIQNLGSCDLMSIKYNDKEIFYPLLKQYLNKIDINNKIIEVNQFDGFFD